VLQALVRMTDLFLQGNLFQEKGLRFGDMPDRHPGILVDILLINQRQRLN